MELWLRLWHCRLRFVIFGSTKWSSVLVLPSSVSLSRQNHVWEWQLWFVLDGGCSLILIMVRRGALTVQGDNGSAAAHGGVWQLQSIVMVVLTVKSSSSKRAYTPSAAGHTILVAWCEQINCWISWQFGQIMTLMRIVLTSVPHSTINQWRKATKDGIVLPCKKEFVLPLDCICGQFFQKIKDMLTSTQGRGRMHWR